MLSTCERREFAIMLNIISSGWIYKMLWMNIRFIMDTTVDPEETHIWSLSHQEFLDPRLVLEIINWISSLIPIIFLKVMKMNSITWEIIFGNRRQRKYHSKCGIQFSYGPGGSASGTEWIGMPDYNGMLGIMFKA